MSWKLFWQIVLLIVIAAVVASTVKVGMLRCKYMGGPMQMKMMQGGRHMMPPK